MKLLENLKLDTWYGILLYLGVALISASLFFNVEFLQEKHLFGLGLGTVLIGLSFVVAEKKRSQFKPPNAYTGPAGILSWKVIEHNWVTRVVQFIGIILVFLFGVLILKGLV